MRRNAILMLICATVMFFSVNMLSRHLLGMYRVDVTEQQLYSLSEGSRLLLENIEADIDLRLYYSQEQANNLPALKAYAERVIEFLNLYARLSGGHVRLQVIDPEPFTDEEDEALAYGVQAVPISTMGDKLYFGVVATNGIDDIEVLPFIDPKRERFLEYDITRVMHRLSHRDKPKMGLVSGLPLDGKMEISQGYQSPWTLMKYLDDVVKTVPVSLEAGVPEEIGILMLVHPQGLSEVEYYAIDQFVMRGGKLIAFTDPLAETPHPMGGLNHGASSLNRLLAGWGVEMLPEQVVGDENLSVRITTGVQSQTRLNTVYYLPWLELTEDYLSDAHAMTADLQLVRVASSGVWERTELGQADWTPIMQTSEGAGLFPSSLMQGQPDAGNLIQIFHPDNAIYTLAGHLSGWLSTNFPDGPPDNFSNPHHVHLHESATPAQLMLVADTDVLRDVFWVQAQDLYGHRLVVPTADNANLVVNMVEYLTGSQALIQLRSRGLVSRPFGVVEAMRRQAEARFHDTEKQLKQELKQTEESLTRLQEKSLAANDAYITPQEQATLEVFRSKLIALRKELRNVQYALQHEIQTLGYWLKFINIWLMPLLLMLGAIIIYYRRKRLYG